MIEVSIQSILDKLSRNIDFLQPVYETIVNSIEAGATEINIIIFKDNNELSFNKKEVKPKFNGFKIIDNGVGFNKDNQKSFSEYLSQYKSKIGCKGIGRFTWLKVFQDISIQSFTKDEKVNIEFNNNFSKDSISIEQYKTKSSKTEITFSNVQKNYFDIDNKKDLRVNADLSLLKSKIEEHLMVKFLLWKKRTNFDLKITLQLDDERDKKEIINTNIELKEKEFTIKNEKFVLYYNFINNMKNKNLSFYCANGRTVESFPEDIKFDKSFINDNSSSIFLLTSSYFDNRVNDIRNKFTFDLKENNESFDNPIPAPQIKNALKNIIDKILIERYPSLKQIKENNINFCIEEYPYLAKYIKEIANDFVLPSIGTLLDKAMSKFKEEKENVKNKFKQMLSNKKIDTKDFENNIKKLSDICNRELAQYFCYRQSIISALNKLNEENNKKEELLHNLFIPKGTVNTKKSVYDSNIWLLDDKYMSYCEIFSDITIKKIKENLKQQVDSKTSKKEPDITIFYNESNGSKDVVVVELKSIGAKTDNKLFAISEINRNLGIIAKQIDNIKTLYGYIITNLDDETMEEIESQQGIYKLFANGRSPIYYYHNNNIKDKSGSSKPCHIYILSTDTLYEDANARNKVFLDIIKNK